MPVSEALTPLCQLLLGGAAVLLLLRHREQRRSNRNPLPRDSLAELFLDHNHEESE